MKICMNNYSEQLKEKKKLKKLSYQSSRRGRGVAERNPTRNREVVGSIPGLAQQVKHLALP